MPCSYPLYPSPVVSCPALYVLYVLPLHPQRCYVPRTLLCSSVLLLSTLVSLAVLSEHQLIHSPGVLCPQISGVISAPWSTQAL